MQDSTERENLQQCRSRGFTDESYNRAAAMENKLAGSRAGWKQMLRVSRGVEKSCRIHAEMKTNCTVMLSPQHLLD